MGGLKFDLDYVSEGKGQSPCGRITEGCLGHLWNQTAVAACDGFLIFKSEDCAKRVRE